jgi:phosphoserine aminotransferase
MSKIYFTPGPSQLYFTVPYHTQNALKESIGAISHRSAAFQTIVKETKANLRALLELKDDQHIYFTASATEIWERIIQNLVEERSHHFVNGAFSQRFFDFALQYQKNAGKTASDGSAEFSNFEIPDGSELISITANETSRGYAFDPEKIRRLRQDHPEKLIALDVVSCLPAVKLPLDQVDTFYFSVQKCFGLPAGLGVWVVNDRCLEKAESMLSKGQLTGSYHSLLSLKKYEEKNQTPETPNMWGIYLLGKVVGDMLNRGLKAIQNETIYKSTLLYQMIEHLPQLNTYVKDKTNQSKTVIVAEVENGNASLLSFLANKKMMVGSGYKEHKDTQIRIANFPAHSKEQIEFLADTIQQYYSE